MVKFIFRSSRCQSIIVEQCHRLTRPLIGHQCCGALNAQIKAVFMRVKGCMADVEVYKELLVNAVFLKLKEYRRKSTTVVSRK